LKLKRPLITGHYSTFALLANHHNSVANLIEVSTLVNEEGVNSTTVPSPSYL